MSHLTRDPIDVAYLIATVGAPERGGTVVFLGSVRRGTEDGTVSGIEYSAYEQMVEAEFSRILAEASERWPHTHCAGQHRLGLVPAGEPSIAVAAAAPHRREAFEACRYVIEEAKTRLPVWKKENFDDGSARWREDVTPTASKEQG